MEQNEQALDENEWLTPQKVAKYRGVSLSTVYSEMKQNPPPYPFYRVTATRRLVKCADLAAWLESVKVSAVMPEQDQ